MMQLTGWKEIVEDVFTVYNTSPQGKKTPLDPRVFIVKACGMETDHAEDQKAPVKLIKQWKAKCD